MTERKVTVQNVADAVQALAVALQNAVGHGDHDADISAALDHLGVTSEPEESEPDTEEAAG